jgi:chaperone BCS1
MANATVVNQTIPQAMGALGGLGLGTGGPESLLGFITSIASLNSWLQLVVIGGALEGVRRIASQIWERILAAFFLTASFDENEACHGESQRHPALSLDQL